MNPLFAYVYGGWVWATINPQEAWVDSIPNIIQHLSFSALKLYPLPPSSDVVRLPLLWSRYSSECEMELASIYVSSISINEKKGDFVTQLNNKGTSKTTITGPFFLFSWNLLSFIYAPFA